MRHLFKIVFVLAISATSLQAERGNFLNCAILSLPAKYLADIPPERRTTLLRELSCQRDDDRLDYKNGYLDFYSDGGDTQASSMFYLKVLPTDNPFDAPVFIHMQKPFNGHKPSKNDTFVLEEGLEQDTWEDITDKILPKGIDRRSYFHPLRKTQDIEVAPWVKSKNGCGYDYGECSTILRWNGKKFDKINIKPRKISGD